MAINVQSCNVRGLNSKQKRIAIFEYIRKQNADLFLIQETHSTALTEKKLGKELGKPSLIQSQYK